MGRIVATVRGIGDHGHVPLTGIVSPDYPVKFYDSRYSRNKVILYLMHLGHIKDIQSLGHTKFYMIL